MSEAKNLALAVEITDVQLAKVIAKLLQWPDDPVVAAENALRILEYDKPRGVLGRALMAAVLEQLPEVKEDYDRLRQLVDDWRLWTTWMMSLQNRVRPHLTPEQQEVLDQTHARVKEYLLLQVKYDKKNWRGMLDQANEQLAELKRMLAAWDEIEKLEDGGK